MLLQNRPPSVGMEQGTVIGANIAVQFIEQINLSTELGGGFRAVSIGLLLFLFFRVFGLFLLLLLLLLLLLFLFFVVTEILFTSLFLKTKF